MKTKKQNVKVQAAEAPAKSETSISKIAVRREILNKLSLQVKPLVESGTFKSVNAALIHSYTTETENTFRTFEEWKNLGCNVIKGSQAYMIWDKPEIGKELPDGSGNYKNFKIKFLFSNTQVENAK